MEGQRRGWKRQVQPGGAYSIGTWSYTVELARSCHYAIRGLVFLASRERPDEPVQLHDIAEAISAPEAFLSKIFQSLRASAIVRSHRGVARGYALARGPAEISLYDVIVATEGPARLHTSPAVAQEAGGSFAKVWTEVEGLVASRLHSTTIEDLVSLSRREVSHEAEAGHGVVEAPLS
jgi:Rrf2 family protein